jgi:hypothetical protein
MFFDFPTFIEQWRNIEQKKELVERYEQLIEPIPNNFKATKIYKEYLSKFKTINYTTPYELTNYTIDWELLMQLIAGSFSSECAISASNNTLPDLVITVHSFYSYNEELPDGNLITKKEPMVTQKKIAELLIFQVYKLFEIYIGESIGMEICTLENKEVNTAIQFERSVRLNRWNDMIDIYLAEHELDNILK